MLYIIAIINFLYAPLILFLRNPPATSSETERLVQSSPAKTGSSRYEPLNNNYGGYNDESNHIIKPQIPDNLDDYHGYISSKNAKWYNTEKVLTRHTKSKYE
uniref:Uncharacterized protein n=1 Tax=Romanomermis culicivorax TaxID=13658 RepID=A0A915HMC8_ROMCU